MTIHINQIAVCIADQRRSTEFYANVLGMDCIFDTVSFRGQLAEKVQGIKNAASTTRWLRDDRACFQLELFQFENPASRPLREEHGITDLGYNRIIVAVRSLVATADLARRAGQTVNAMESLFDAGNTAHAWLQDPDGIIIELVEMPERIVGSRSAQIIGLGLTSPDLGLSVEDMCGGLGFSPCADIFEHGNYWDVDGRLEQRQTLQLDDMFLVVSQYRDARARIADYQLADIGIMNFAMAFPYRENFIACYEHTQAMGMCSNSAPLEAKPDLGMVYNNDRQGFSVEMCYMSEKHHSLYDFTRPGLRDRVLHAVAEFKAQGT